MKLENLIEALGSMMNIGGGSWLYIVDAAGNDLWRGCLAEFDKKSWFNREIVAWAYTDVTDTVIILVEW